MRPCRIVFQINVLFYLKDRCALNNQVLKHHNVFPTIVFILVPKSNNKLTNKHYW